MREPLSGPKASNTGQSGEATGAAIETGPKAPDRVEEADLESFPASDPPPGPDTIAPDKPASY